MSEDDNGGISISGERLYTEIQDINKKLSELTQALAEYPPRMNRLDKDVEEIGERVREIERWKWNITGRLTVISVLVSAAVAALTKFLVGV